ncbi:DUF4440 domain-containing protein [Acidipila sp. EB88]|uniref:DUF4440 domain-containing protein n=1 Tax=Acidipila sp. EB88 TaxID=2305226 RepID=UPI0013155234|nr:DUF4440 domain-containing protein [Acidipila sp. EB88]
MAAGWRSAVLMAAMVLAPAALMPVQAAAQVAQSPVLQFQKLEDAWSVALANKDQFGLENLLLPTFIDISASGAVLTRNQAIADTLNGLPEPLLSVEQKVVNVRVVSDVAVVQGTYILRLKDDQKTRDERGIFTHVYQRSRNTWACISAQRTAVVDQIEGAKGRATAAEPQRKSNAAQPFHIPLLYKGAQPKPGATAPAGSGDAPDPRPGVNAPDATPAPSAAPASATPPASANPQR